MMSSAELGFTQGEPSSPPLARTAASAADVLIGMYMQYWHSLALLCAANLGIADEFGTDVIDVRGLAQRLGVHPIALFRLMRALTSRGIFRQTGPHEFAHTSLSEALRSSARGGACAAIRALGLGFTHPSPTAYLGSITTGASTVEPLDNSSKTNDFFAGTPTDAQLYDIGMTAITTAQTEIIQRSFDFSQFRTVADIGGGQGAFLASLLVRNRQQLGILFDCPRVASSASALMRQFAVDSRCTIVAGDLRSTVPKGADAYILKNVLHGFTDEQSAGLLTCIRKNAGSRAHLIIIELVMPTGSPPVAHAAFDLFLLAGGVGSRVRTEKEFHRLLTDAGFQLLRVVPTACRICIIDAIAI